MMRMSKNNQAAFALPAVVLISTIAMIMLTAALQTLLSQTGVISVEYRKNLAADAAEAGLHYATVCLKKNGNNAVWTASSDNTLRQNTNCAGEYHPAAGAPVQATYVYEKTHSGGSLRVRFEVGTPEFSVGSGTNFTAVGIVEQLNSSGTVLSTVKRTQRKVILWDNAGDVTKVFTGPGRTCFIRKGKAWCWGRTYHGLLGEGTDADGVKSVPTPVDESSGLAGKTLVDIAGGESHTCVQTSDHQVWCWGENYRGQFGNNGSGRSAVPVRTQFNVSGSYTVKDIAGWGRGMCAILDLTSQDEYGKVYCWGDRHWGATGTGDGTTSSSSASALRTPTQISTENGPWDKVLAADYEAIKLSTSGSQTRSMCMISSRTLGAAVRPYCWGRNSGVFGVLGRGTTDDNVNDIPQVVSVLPNDIFVHSITLEGDADNPAQVPSTLPVTTQISSPHVCIYAGSTANDDFTGEKSVYCWGNGVQGQLGNGNTGANSVSQVPVLVEQSTVPADHYTDVQAGISHTCGRRHSGTVRCWGQHVYNGAGGMIGQNSTQQNYATPVQVNGDLAGKTVDYISIGSNRSCAFGKGFAYCWGRNFAGQIGDGTWCETEYNAHGPNSSLFLQCNRVDRFTPTRSRFLEQPVQEFFY